MSTPPDHTRLTRLRRRRRLMRDEGSSQPNERNFTNHKLDSDSLNTLEPGEWLDDGIIDTFFRSLCLAQPGQFVTFDSTALNYLVEVLTPSSEDAEPLQQATIYENCKPFRTLAATVTGNNGLVFMPFCFGYHWILAVADFQRHIIRVYDSMVRYDESGRVFPSEPGQSIIPVVREILSFCIGQGQWPVETMWLPIERTLTECGVYICLMGLQHAFRRGFTPDDYACKFCSADGMLIYSVLGRSYWAAGRRLIFEVCRRYFRPDSDGTTPEDVSRVETAIDGELRTWLWPSLFPSAPHMPQFRAQYGTIVHVAQGVRWLKQSIHCLNSIEEQHLSHNERVLNRAPRVSVTLLDERVMGGIVNESVNYAWHDEEELKALMSDLSQVELHLRKERQIAKRLWDEKKRWEDSLSPEEREALLDQAQGHVEEVTTDTAPSPPSYQDEDSS